MCTRQVQMNILGGLAQNANGEGREAKTEQPLIYCTKTKMKKIDEHFVESLLEGVTAKVK
jgi:hypothetical protein